MQLLMNGLEVNINFDPAAVANLLLLSYLHLKQKKVQKKIVLHNADEIDIAGLKFRKGEDF